MISASVIPGIGLINSLVDTSLDFEELTPDEKLHLLLAVYENMGESITSVTSGATRKQFVQKLLNEIKAMDEDQQIKLMRDLVNRADTQYTREYGTLTDDDKLAFWHGVSQLMQRGEVALVQKNRNFLENSAKVFKAIALMDFSEQIIILRHIVIDLGKNKLKNLLPAWRYTCYE